jgi:hypothetical protein
MVMMGRVFANVDTTSIVNKGLTPKRLVFDANRPGSQPLDYASSRPYDAIEPGFNC